MTDTIAPPGSVAARLERRWPIVLAILAVVVITDNLPDHLQVMPSFTGYLAAACAAAAMALVAWSRDGVRWLRLEDAVVTATCLMLLGGCILALRVLITSIVGGSSPIGGFELLSSSVAVWVNNMLGFALLYWVTDRGGPRGRLAGADARPDWLFPQMSGAPGTAADWEPAFVDYLSLAFWTATAFSPTDVAPLTARAKLLMMAQASISLVTLVVVASRAINVLGS